MHDDDLMDGLLKDALAAGVPQLPADFDARVMRRVRRKQLTPGGRVVMAVYGVSAAVTAVWLMRDLPAEAIVVAMLIGVAVACGASAYGRRLVVGG
jgi:hypothetical protein